MGEARGSRAGISALSFFTKIPFIRLEIPNMPISFSAQFQVAIVELDYVANVFQANLIAASSETNEAKDQVYNLAPGDRTSLNARFFLLRNILVILSEKSDERLIYRDFRLGDICHSRTNILKAQHLSGY